MQTAGHTQKELTREVAVTVIPSGEAATLPEGIPVTITHRLGGHFTVVCDFGMFRIQGADADCIGEDVPASAGSDGAAGERIPPSHQVGADGKPTESLLWDQLKSVYDPEIPVNIVDLGLVYSLDIKEPGEDSADAADAETSADKQSAKPTKKSKENNDDADAAPKQWDVDMAMTLTAPGCGMGPVIAEDAKNALELLSCIGSATVEIVWDPPWHQEMISTEGKMQLGLI